MTQPTHPSQHSQEHHGGATARPVELENVSALLELCDAQQQVIDRLQRALEEHEEVETDRHLLKRMLAHELRTPLAAIIGTLHTMALPKIDEAKRDDLRQKALRQSENLSAMIEDVLHLSEPHGASVDRTPQEWVNVADLVNEVADSVVTVLPHERLVIDVPDDLTLRTVPTRVRQILLNLLVNAAKYSPEDSPVSVTATRLEYELVFEVVDRGPGIDADLVDAVFDAGARGLHPGVEGAGLGLYLTRQLVRSLRGSIELFSREGGGTLARVSLPQRRLEDARPPSEARRRLRVVGSDTVAANNGGPNGTTDI